MADIEAENNAIIEDRDKTIRKVYHGKDGGSSAYKTYLDAKAIDPRITLDWVRGWFKKNVKRQDKKAGQRIHMWRRVPFTSTKWTCFSLPINNLQIKITP